MTASASDQDLVRDAQAGQRAAMAQLYERHHPDAARLARILSGGNDPDDLVSEAFARTFAKVREAAEPIQNFRAYLHTVIRRLNIDRIRSAGRESAASDRPWLLDVEDEEAVEAYDALDAEQAARALRTLPDNWQHLLWTLDVEGRKVVDVAHDLSVPAAKISSTIYRAREGLRRAYLDQHIPSADSRRCSWTRDHLGRHVRGDLGTRASARIEDHLDLCPQCATVYREIDELNRRLGVVYWPITVAAVVGIGAAPMSSSTSGTSAKPRSRSNHLGQGSARLSRGARVSVVTTVATVAVASAAIVLTSWLTDGTTPQAEAADTPAKTVKPHRPAPPLLETIVEPPPPPRDDERQPDDVTGEPERNIGPQLTPAPDPTPSPEPPVEPEPEPQPVDLSMDPPSLTPTATDYQWLLTVPIHAVTSSASEAFTIELTVSMDLAAGFIDRTAEGWDCGGIEAGGSNGDPYFFQTVTCQYAYVPGQPVTPFALVIEAIDPAGTATVTGVGNDDPDTGNNTQAFSAP